MCAVRTEVERIKDSMKTLLTKETLGLKLTLNRAVLLMPSIAVTFRRCLCEKKGKGETMIKSTVRKESPRR